MSDLATSLPFSRRQFLALGEGALAFAAPTLLLPGVARADVGDQRGWRFCNKCRAMFWNGASDNKGVCPAGGGHNALGFLFNIHYDTGKPAVPNVQYDWRFCSKCWTMFWDGDPNNKGRCQKGGGHTAQGLMFGLSSQPPGQADWRFCDKCRELFWNGAADKGRCPAGGGHNAQGFTFFIKFDPEPAQEQPQARTITLTPVAAIDAWTDRNFKDEPVIGTFNKHGTVCVPYGQFPGSLQGMVGWGQGTSANDACMVYILQHAIDFDTSVFTNLTSVERAVLTYDEAPASACPLVAGTTDTCWQSGGGHPESKPNGCAVVRVPSANWRQAGPKGLLAVLRDGQPPVKQISAREWDVTDALRWRLSPPIGADPGFGFVLTGSPRSLDELKALDRTICTSSITNIRLTVNYTVSAGGGFVQPK
jgi:hypothetical protein